MAWTVVSSSSSSIRRSPISRSSISHSSTVVNYYLERFGSVRLVKRIHLCDSIGGQATHIVSQHLILSLLVPTAFLAISQSLASAVLLLWTHELLAKMCSSPTLCSYGEDMFDYITRQREDSLLIVPSLCQVLMSHSWYFISPSCAFLLQFWLCPFLGLLLSLVNSLPLVLSMVSWTFWCHSVRGDLISRPTFPLLWYTGRMIPA